MWHQGRPQRHSPHAGLALQMEVSTVAVASIPVQKVGEEC
jgi:hypothetical protein